MAPLSNMYPAKVQIDGITDAVHAFQYSKCIFAGAQTQAQQISETSRLLMYSKTAREINPLARMERLPWGETKRNIEKKFLQISNLQEIHLKTGTDNLVGCSEDTFWGSACSIDSRLLDHVKVVAWGPDWDTIRPEQLYIFIGRRSRLMSPGNWRDTDPRQSQSS